MNEKQRYAAIDIKQWLHNKLDRTVKCVGGEPGTGKTHFLVELIKYLELRPYEYLVMAYTGQACSNLIRRNVTAKTIHSSILEQYSRAKTIDGIPIVRGGIPVMVDDFRKTEYISDRVILLIIDEASFLPDWLEIYLLSYGIKLLLIGDPEQLPPVVGKQVFTLDRLDHLFTEPMRQNIDSDIYRLTMDIRHNRMKDIMDYHGKDVIIIRDKLSPEKLVMKYQDLLKHADACLTVSNKCRQVITDVSRRLFLNTEDPRPVRGERLVCRKNNYRKKVGDHLQYPLVNGTTGTVVTGITASKISYKEKTYTIDFKPTFLDDDYHDNLLCDLDFLMQPFGDKVIDKYNPGNKLEYAQALTVHLSQGDQYNNVAFFGGWFMDRNMTRRINHVATSRAVEQLIWFYPY